MTRELSQRAGGSCTDNDGEQARRCGRMRAQRLFRGCHPWRGAGMRCVWECVGRRSPCKAILLLIQDRERERPRRGRERPWEPSTPFGLATGATRATRAGASAPIWQLNSDRGHSHRIRYDATDEIDRVFVLHFAARVPPAHRARADQHRPLSLRSVMAHQPRRPDRQRWGCARRG